MISDLDQDDFGYPVNIEQVTYVTRQLADGSSVDLPMWVFTPGVDNMPEGAMPEGGWPVIVFVRVIGVFVRVIGVIVTGPMIVMGVVMM